MLLKQLADEIGPQGGRTFGLMPGSIATARMQELEASSPDPKAAAEQRDARIPLRRIGQAAEFGRVAAFLLSDAASYLSGCIVPVDGGALQTF